MWVRVPPVPPVLLAWLDWRRQRTSNASYGSSNLPASSSLPLYTFLVKPESLRMRQWRDARKKLCPDCGAKIAHDSERCMPCSRAFRAFVNRDTVTIGEWRGRLSLKGKHPSWLHAQVRTMARYYNRHLAVNGCMNCGYSLHVEFCHIKAISEWPDDTLIAIVNAEENILCLCRNCHWELHHDLISVETIKSRCISLAS